MFDRPLRDRDGALIEHWYVACTSSELRPCKPMQRLIYDTPLVLFRDNHGKPTCLLDRCLHRAAQLSRGRVQAGSLQCPYHGWTYDARGRVVDIPSEGPERRTEVGEQDIRRLCLPARACVEQDGLIWVWMGANPSAPQPASPPWRLPHHGEAGWAHYVMITDFENEVTHLVENFMDVPHTPFVHAGWFRSRANLEVPMTLEIKQSCVLVTYHQKQDRIGFTGRIVNPGGAPMEHTDHFIFPNLTNVTYRFGDRRSFVINSQCTPVSTLRTRVYTHIAFVVGAITPLMKPFMQWYTRQVIEQDVIIMQNQGQSFRLHKSLEFKSTDADEVHLAIEHLRSLGAKGDPELFAIARKKEKLFWI